MFIINISLTRFSVFFLYVTLILEKLVSSIFYFLGQMYENILFSPVHSDHYIPQNPTWSYKLAFSDNH